MQVVAVAWQVYLLSFISGASVTVNFPARQAMIPALVPPGEVGRAVAGIAAGQNGARVVSPGLAGALISVSGLASCFFAQVVVFAIAVGRISLAKSGSSDRPKFPG